LALGSNEHYSLNYLKQKSRLILSGFFYTVIFNNDYNPCPWQLLYFLPLPQGQGSLRPIFASTRIGCILGFCCAFCSSTMFSSRLSVNFSFFSFGAS
jgi:hypothetical protein